MTPSILAILKEFKYADEAMRSILRGKLYRTFLQNYETLKNKGVSLIHFHTHDYRSLLRMYVPETFGDFLLDVRPDVYKANRELKIVRGFEVGKNVIGYRNIYPIIFNGDHLGSVEISFPFETIRKTMAGRYGEIGFILLINAKKATYFAENRNEFYKGSFIHENWLEENISPNNMDATKPITEEQRSVFGKLKDNKIFIENLNYGKASTFEKVVYGNHYIITLLPIYNTENKLSATLISLIPSPHLKSSAKRFYIINGILLFVATVVAYTTTYLYNVYRKRVKKMRNIYQRSLRHSTMGYISSMNTEILFL